MSSRQNKQNANASRKASLHTFKASIRQPVSCEPCRKRKIRCSRTQPPCETCQKRRCVDLCIYAAASGNAKAQEDDIAASQPELTNESLLARINNLESMLLRQQTLTQLGAGKNEEFDLEGQMLSPPIEEASESYGWSPDSSSSALQTPGTSVVSPPQHVGFLRTSSTGNVRHEARSSQWTAILANTDMAVTVPSLEEEEDTRDEDPSQDWCGFPLTASSVFTVDELIEILPPMQQCDYLKDMYFRVFSPLFHILHDPTFHKDYRLFVSNPAIASVSWLAILFVVLSLAVSALEDEDPILRDLARGPSPGNNIRTLAKRYRRAAMKCLAKQGVIWGKHNVQSLQALVLLGYAMSHSQEQTWILLGMTYNVAIALGCHIDPENFKLNPIQIEERRRCWAGMMMLYTIQSTILGNPDPTCRLSQYVKLPADANDTDITITGIKSPASGPTQMSYLLFKFRLYSLASSICTEVSSPSLPSRSTIQSLDAQICLVQESWDSRYLGDSAVATLPTHHAMHLHILQGYAHQLFLLLHRPFFAQSLVDLGVPNESQIRSISSAEALLDIHRLLCETPSLKPYKWYTYGLGSFHAFHAATVLAVALLMPIYRCQWPKFEAAVQDCVARMSQMAPRSGICKKAARILESLIEKLPRNGLQFHSQSFPPAAPLSPGLQEAEVAEEVETYLTPDSVQVQFFIDRLQSQQWLSPSSTTWAEWENILN